MNMIRELLIGNSEHPIGEGNRDIGNIVYFVGGRNRPLPSP